MSEKTSNVDVKQDDNQPPKTAKQLEKEAIKKAKLEKLQQKLDKKAATVTVPSKEKQEKKSKEVKETIVYNSDTKPGEKKDISGAIPDSYSPQYVEAAWYSWWEKEGFFKPEYGRESISTPNPKGQFVMVIPPPNITGSLHLGHALTNSIQDAVTRWHRMKGRTTLWVPGCDHAGIATQVVVEKKLWRDNKLSRHDIGREKFIEKIWDWRNEKGDRIYHQLKRIGSSFDWDRACFTMDKKISESVYEAFVRLHEEGCIYRSNRLVNWSCTLRSAISDIEVDKIELPGRTFLSIPGYNDKIEFGVLISFAYKVDNSDEEIVVATTRIETMLGDTAVAVHPNDTRYQHLHGKFCIHPFTDRKLPIVCDEFVEMEFGTGAVKITPGHDQNDYDVGKRHNLPFITIFNDDGIIIGDYGKYTGMKRFDCRKEILMELKTLNLYKETKDNPMVVPMCSRSKDVVEPLIKPQWYVRCDDMAAAATEAVKSGELKIIPEIHEKTWYHWMDGIRDWCISRQLWWGHRIPAYFVTFTDDSTKTGDRNDENYWVVGRTADDALERASKRFNVDKAKIVLEQDEDVLDTWFSSALFPFSVFNWPNQTDDLMQFYPNTLLETGHDILFFWVARMVFFGQKLLKKLPFKEVYLHPIVRDAHGRKMSKSLGNVIDPMDVIMGISLEDLHKQLYDSNLDPKEIDKAKAGQKQDYPNGIPECGTDAMRFALCSYMTQGRDINLDILRVQGYRFFCNKIWNATKFVLYYFNDTKYDAIETLSNNESKIDLWILSRLSKCIEICNQSFENYEFAIATNALYNFWIYDLCDIYLECLKPLFQNTDPNMDAQKECSRQILYTCLEYSLKLISPFMPFISEELYQRLPRKNLNIKSICIAAYPEINENTKLWQNEKIEKEFDFIQKCGRIIRSARSDYNLPNKIKTEIFIQCNKQDVIDVITDYKEYLITISYCSKVNVNEKPPIGCAILTITGDCQVYLLLKGLIEIDKEIEKLDKKKNNLEVIINKLNQLILSDDYNIKVPIDIQNNNTEKLNDNQNELIHITKSIDILKNMSSE